MNFIFLGPPGAGKGTQAKLLSAALSIPHISTGDILRTEKDNKTEIGLLAIEYMDKGQFVPDEIVIGLVEARIKCEDAKNGFILDGYPRSLTQAHTLAGVFERLNYNSLSVVNVIVPEKELIDRLSGRMNCASCGASYHENFSPPKEPNTCDKCQKELFVRADDKEEAIKHRLERYNKEHDPLADYYQAVGLLYSVNGIGEVKDVFNTIASILRIKAK